MVVAAGVQQGADCVGFMRAAIYIRPYGLHPHFVRGVRVDEVLQEISGQLRTDRTCFLQRLQTLGLIATTQRLHKLGRIACLAFGGIVATAFARCCHGYRWTAYRGSARLNGKCAPLPGNLVQ